jgi:hypothetical protein
MAVTDLTDSLPWWARQGGPGPTGGPGAAPQGSGASSQDWLRYLMAMANQGGGNPANMPSPDASNMSVNVVGDDHGDGDNPPAPPFVAPPAPPVASNGPPPGSILPQARGGANPPGPMAASPSILPQARGVSNPPFPGGPSILPQARGVAVQPGAMSPGDTTMPAPAGPLATGGATANGASANPRFIGIAQPNASPQNSLRGGPQATALNLAGLFGGGGNPNVPAANAQPMSGRLKGPMAQGGVANAPMPPIMPDDIRRQRAMQLAAASLKQRYG